MIPYNFRPFGNLCVFFWRWQWSVINAKPFNFFYMRKLRKFQKFPPGNPNYVVSCAGLAYSLAYGFAWRQMSWMFKMFWHFSHCKFFIFEVFDVCNVFEYLPTCLLVFLPIWTHLNAPDTPERIRTYLKVSKRIRTHPNSMSGIVRTLFFRCYQNFLVNQCSETCVRS